jgi:hypothetical protein
MRKAFKLWPITTINLNSLKNKFQFFQYTLILYRTWNTQHTLQQTRNTTHSTAHPTASAFETRLTSEQDSSRHWRKYTHPQKKKEYRPPRQRWHDPVCGGVAFIRRYPEITEVRSVRRQIGPNSLDKKRGQSTAVIWKEINNIQWTCWNTNTLMTICSLRNWQWCQS